MMEHILLSAQMVFKLSSRRGKKKRKVWVHLITCFLNNEKFKYQQYCELSTCEHLVIVIEAFYYSSFYAGNFDVFEHRYGYCNSSVLEILKRSGLISFNFRYFKM